MQNPPFKFKFSLLPGDLINALAGIRHVCLKHKRKAIIYLGLNIEWQMDDTVKSGRTTPYTLTDETMKMFIPLLESQEYIDSVRSWGSNRPDEYAAWGEFHKTAQTQKSILEWYATNMTDIVDLDKHQVVPINMPVGNIFRWNFYCFPDMACDLSVPWIEVPTNDLMPPDTILINRTARSQNPNISYSFLKKYEKKLLFVGTHDEWNSFRFEHGVSLACLQLANFWELAVAIKSCAFFIGNQSLCFSLAEALKVPRILEICRERPCVIPTGDKAYDFYFQSTLEYYVNELAR